MTKENKNIEEVAQKIQDHFFSLGATIRKQDWDFLLETLTQHEEEVRKEDIDEVIKKAEQGFGNTPADDLANEIKIKTLSDLKSKLQEIRDNREEVNECRKKVLEHIATLRGIQKNKKLSKTSG